MLASGTLRQPDPRSCGAAVAVAARMLADPALAEALVQPDAFARAVLAQHRGANGWRDRHGRLQAPWPRALGTAPWALARDLGSPEPWRCRGARGSGRARALTAALDAVHGGGVAAAYVGSASLPRHVVLAVGDDDRGLRCYDPARGRVRLATSSDWAAGRLDLAGWTTPWFVLTPA